MKARFGEKVTARALHNSRLEADLDKDPITLVATREITEKIDDLKWIQAICPDCGSIQAVPCFDDTFIYCCAVCGSVNTNA